MITASEKIKARVRERYAKLVTSADQARCCESSCCGRTAVLDAETPESMRAVPGYRQEEVKSLPPEAMENSFGCGNPTAFAEILPGQVVVDIGSGVGIDCLLAARKVGNTGQVIGIDMTPAMIEKAKANTQKAGSSNVEFRLGEAERMPIEDGIADWVISNCVINLSPDKPSVFQETFRVLKPGGRLSITDIMVEKLPWILRRSVNLYTSCVAGAIPEAQYLKGLRDAGFSDVRVTQRTVYDRTQLMGLISGSLLFRPFARFLKRPLSAVLDRFVVGKVLSAKVIAQKPSSGGI